MIKTSEKVATIFFNLAHFFLIMPLFTIMLYKILKAIDATSSTWVVFLAYVPISFLYSFTAIYLNVMSYKRRKGAGDACPPNTD